MAKPLPRIDEPQRPERPDTASHKPNVMSVARLENPPDAKEPVGHSRTLRHVMSLSIKKLPMRHREILSKKINQLLDADARLMDGSYVTNKSAAILWIIENEVKL
jgi:hypothetical protein